jgi:hypothetical protein
VESRQVVQRQHHRGEPLAHLVVQLLRDPQALTLLSPALSRRSASSLATISLKVSVTARSSGTASPLGARAPGRKGSAPRMNARRCSSGDSARRRRAKFNASIVLSPTARTAASVIATGKLTVAGDSTSAAAATTSTSAFVTNTRQKSGIR